MRKFNKLLGVDYGRGKIGLAVSTGTIADPYKVIRVNGFDDAVEKTLLIASELGVTGIVVGISESFMALEQKKFAEAVSGVTSDETLSTLEAQELSKQAGISRKKRHEMEDAYAASIILQNYLDR